MSAYIKCIEERNTGNTLILQRQRKQ
ncbi:hypothetical protein [Eubacterium sp.]